jgi:hypothetical protein
MQGVLRGMDKDEMDDLLLQTKAKPGELMDVSASNSGGAQKLKPQNLTGSHGEARQEQ